MRFPIKKLTAAAMTVALGLALQLIESLVPLPINLPGGKLGLANMAILTVIPLFSPLAAVGISLIRAALGSLLFGGGISFLYSLSGAALSSLIMVWAYRSGRVGFPGIGMLGAAAHNTAQVLVAVAIFGNGYLFSYLSVLLVISVITGGFTGYAVGLLYKKGIKE